jgi:hypothetical protein
LLFGLYVGANLAKAGGSLQPAYSFDDGLLLKSELARPESDLTRLC